MQSYKLLQEFYNILVHESMKMSLVRGLFFRSNVAYA